MHFVIEIALTHFLIAIPRFVQDELPTSIRQQIVDIVDERNETITLFVASIKDSGGGGRRGGGSGSAKQRIRMLIRPIEGIKF